MGDSTQHSIAIIGGSLAGCMAAVLLSRAGHNVNVYERSKRGLVGRGGGVTTSRTVLDRMIAADLIDAEFPSAPYSELQLSKISEEETTFGRCPLTCALDMNCVHWSGLWENIRKRVPDEIYNHNVTLQSAVQRGDQVDLTFEDGRKQKADLVLFADGYHSLGRRIMFPNVALEYRGYTVWRGVVPESDIAQVPQLDIHPRFSLRARKGSFISYMIPNRDGTNMRGGRQFNWACYFPLAQADLAEFMIDNKGQPRVGTIPAGAMREAQDQALKAMIAEELPSFYAGVVAKSENNQIQQIYTTDLEAYAKGRMCLMGDAGMMVPPLTGAGVFKGFTNALELTEALGRDTPLDEALSAWSTRQTRVAKSMLAMGLDMENAFIWDTIDLATETPEACAAWFDRSITIAKEFSYFAA
jgi:2-polyprenyl-6-methoxyphenol hydroxylase-like FAD-dependent oxidoreductase